MNPTLTPAYKLASLLHGNRTAINSSLCDARQIVAEGLAALARNDDEGLNTAAKALDQAAGRIRSRLLQIRAVKDAASAVGVKPNELKGGA